MDHDGLYTAADGVALRFYEEPKENAHASQTHGRPIYDACLMVEVITPGQRESAPIFELERVFADEVGIPTPRRSPKYDQYKQQVDAYRSGHERADLRGTPLTAWPAISTTIAAAAKHAGVYTVEALANLPDTRLSALGPGALSLRSRAIAFLAAASGNADSEAIASELAETKIELTRVQSEVADLSARLTAANAQIAASSGAALPVVTGAPVAPPVTDVQHQTQPVAKTKPVKAGGGNTMPDNII